MSQRHPQESTTIPRDHDLANEWLVNSQGYSPLPGYLPYPYKVSGRPQPSAPMPVDEQLLRAGRER